jgi:ribonuclease HI
MMTTSVDDEFVPEYYVYTDGACSGNGTDMARAGIGIYFGPGDVRNVSMKKDGTQTNNAAELTAILETYPIIERDIAKGVRVTIVTDSQYAIRCCSTYGRKCATRGWDRLDIPNKALVRKAYETYYVTPTVQFMFVRAHTSATDIHSIGNRLADRLATTGCWGSGLGEGVGLGQSNCRSPNPLPDPFPPMISLPVTPVRACCMDDGVSLFDDSDMFPIPDPIQSGHVGMGSTSVEREIRKMNNDILALTKSVDELVSIMLG